MSLEQPSRLAHWPRIAIRVALILLVFVGLNWWTKNQKNQQATSPTVVEKTYTPPAAELRDGIAIALIWDVQDVQKEADQTSTPATIAWRDAEAKSIANLLKRLTQYASQHSEVPLRVGLLVSGSASVSTTEDAHLQELLPMDAPALGQEVEQSLEQIQPGVRSQIEEALLRSQMSLAMSGLNERHVIIVGSEKSTANGVLKQMQAGDKVTHVHYLKRNVASAKMDEQFKTILDQILTPVR